MSILSRQETLNLNTDTSIAVIGCGGVGFWVAKYAAMTGINTIYLFDPDIIEDHNLNRIDVPMKCIGMNKADLTKQMINMLRPDCKVVSLPFKLLEHTCPDVKWLVDCTDNISSQSVNQDIAKKKGMKYVRAGYNGDHMTITTSVAEWGDAPDGYTIVPSWVVPASVVAALTVAHIVKYNTKTLSTDVNNLFS